MNYYIIAGEPSGDLHGARLIRALSAADPHARFRAWGGDQMQAAGASLAKHIRDLAIMGPVQVLLKLRTILRNFRYCHEDIQQFEPDVLILIDYSGFNLRIAKWAKAHNYKVFYYISPQVWATREGRVKKIKKYVDEMFVILPFEKQFYQKHDYAVNFVGHPLLDQVAEHQVAKDFHQKNQLDPERKIIALLPGSRKQEVRAILSRMLEIVRHYPQFQFVIAGAPTLDRDFYQPFVQEYKQVHLVEQQTYDLLGYSHAALVTSGTATLETALFKVPQVVCYKTHPIFYWIVKQIIKLPYISLVNIIMNRELVTELIQGDLKLEKLQPEFEKLLQEESRSTMLAAYDELQRKLGDRGAAARAATKMLARLEPPAAT